MKQLTLIFAIFVSVILMAQSPQSFKYQAIVRNSNGDPVSNQNIGIRISILQGSATGNTIYSETFNETTNDFGLVNLNIGTGNTSDDFASIDWGQSPYFLKVEIDENGGTNYSEISNSELLSVPYSLYSQTAQTALNVPQNVSQLTNDAGYITNANDADADPTNELQVLNISNDTLYLTNGGQVYLGQYSSYWSRHGSDLYYNNGYVGVGTDAPGGPMVIKGDTTLDPDSALFEVKNKDGQTIFAVYDGGVRIFVADDTSANKVNGQKAGFAVGGYRRDKALTNEYMRVTPDSVRFWILDDDPNKVNGQKAGFAVGGYRRDKSIASYYWNINSSDTTSILTPSEPRILWYPTKEAFLTGRVLIESPDSVGRNSFASGFESKAAGDYSQAMGRKARAGAYNTTAIGVNVNAAGINSMAFGDSSLAAGFSSYAFGTVGYDTLTMEPTDFATRAMGDYSLAIGFGNLADSLGTIVFGTNSAALGEFSFASGLLDTSYAAYSVAIGVGSSTKGEYSAAIGLQNQSTANGAYAIGAKNISSGNGAFTLGYINDASGLGAFALGAGNISSNDGSFVLGVYSQSTGRGAYAIGDSVFATGDGAYAIGLYSEASGAGSFTIGTSNIAADSGAFAIGINNKALYRGAFAFGVGDTAGAASAYAFGFNTNAMGFFSTTLGFDTKALGIASTAFGNTTVASGGSSTAFGNRTTASGSSSTAFGSGTEASGDYSTAFGSNTYATNYYTVAFGNSTNASGNSATAFGSGTAASGNFSSAYGYYTIASGNYSTAFGTNTTADGDYSTAFGRTIVVNGENSVGIGLNSSTYTISGDNIMSIMGGNVGIGTTAPGRRLHVVGYNEASARFTFTTSFGTAGGGTLIEFYSKTNSNGLPQLTGDITVDNSGNVSYNSFTGSHLANINEKVSSGMLISLTGNNSYIDKKNKTGEIVYGAQLCQQENSPNVLGAYFSKHNDKDLVMAVGNGVMWVVDNGEDLNVGDYLISSAIPGHAIKDNGKYDVAHIIARVAEPVKWSKETKTINGIKHKKVSVFFESFDLHHYEKQLSKQSEDINKLKQEIEELKQMLNVKAEK